MFECNGKTESMSALCRLRKLAPSNKNTIVKIDGALKTTGSCRPDDINSCPGGRCEDGRCECADDFTFLNGSCTPNAACKWSPCNAFAGNCTVNRDDTENFYCNCPTGIFVFSGSQNLKSAYILNYVGKMYLKLNEFYNCRL